MAIDTAIADPQIALQAAQGGAAPSRTSNAAKAHQTAQDFEAQFLSQMVEHMFAGVNTSGLFGGGSGEQMFRSMLFDEFGKVLARAGGIGLADPVQREILKIQEAK